MIRTTIASALALAAAAVGPAAAQVHDGIDNSPAQQRTADTLRAEGSKCGAPACRNDPQGLTRPSSGPGIGAKDQSISAGQSQPHD